MGIRRQVWVVTYIAGEITAETAQQVLLAVQVAAMKKIGLLVWVCSIGGDVLPALAIYDALRRYPQTEAIATGECQSAALVAFLGARRRMATPNTVFLNHEITAQEANSLGGYHEFPRRRLSLTALDELEALPMGHFDAIEAKRLGIIQDLYGEVESEAIEIATNGAEAHS